MLFLRRLQDMDSYPIWLVFVAGLVADCLDVVSSQVDSALIPGWTEANTLARDPFFHKFWMAPALVLHLEYYILFALPFTLLLYYALKNTLPGDYDGTAVVAAWIASIPLWFELYNTLDAALGNIGLLVMWLGWLQPLFQQ